LSTTGELSDLVSFKVMSSYILDTEAHGLVEPHATEIAYIGVVFSPAG